MPPRFELGTVIVKEDAAFVLARAGQDADFFLAKHAAGDWGEEDAAGNEYGLREGSLLWSSYRTLRGQQLLVITFLESKETVLFCPPNSVVNYVPLPDMAHWYKKEG
jgi:hypothetical protein